MEKQAIYNAYKPLKNSLSKLSINDSIYVIYNYHLYISDFKNKLPDNISVPDNFYNLDEIERGIFNWDLEILLREILVNGKPIEYSEYYNKETLRKYKYIFNCLNKLNSFEDTVSSIYLNYNNAKFGVSRIAHQQFKWQSNPYNPIYLYRYYRIFNNDEIKKLIYKLFDLSIAEIYYIGVYLMGFFINNFKLKKEDLYLILDKEKIDNFFKLFSIGIEELKKEAKKRKLNDKFEYDFFVLEFFPIIEKDNNFICPLIILLFWSFTSGMYFKIRYKISDNKPKQKIFDEAFGKSFELYIGELLNKSNEMNFSLFPENYYSNNKKTPDWIVYDNIDSAMFIECKTKRLNFNAKIDINGKLVEEELNKLADASIQLYKRIKDYKNNEFDNFKFDKKINIFPIIITLENWNMIFYLEQIRNITEKKIEKNKAIFPYFKKIPIAIFSCKEFEEIIQIINQVGIKKFMNQIHGKVFSISNNIATEPFIKNYFEKEKKNVIFLFQKELDELLKDFENKNI